MIGSDFQITKGNNYPYYIIKVVDESGDITPSNLSLYGATVTFSMKDTIEKEEPLKINKATNQDDGGKVTSATSSTLVNSSKSWVTNYFTGKKVKILSGTGVNQIRTISSSTATTLTISSNWTTIPDTTSIYTVYDSPNVVITDYLNWIIEYHWGSTDTDTIGLYDIEFEFTLLSGEKFTIPRPENKPERVRIVESLS